MDFKKWYWNEFGGIWDDLAPVHRELIEKAFWDGYADGYDDAKWED